MALEQVAELLTYRQAAELLNVPVGSLYCMVSQKRVPHLRLSGRMVRFDAADLRAWLDARRVPATLAGSASRGARR